MSTTFRLLKGSPLTDQELDDNFRYVYEWNSSDTYSTAMVVLYVTGNSFYRAKTNVPANIVPGSESSPTTYWELLGPANFPFDGTRTITRDGIPNVAPGGTTADDFLNAFFYPSKAPDLSMTLTTPVREFGASNSVSLPYTVTKHTKGVTSITLNGDVVAVGSNINDDSDPDGNQQTGTHSSTVTQNVNATISGQVTTALETVNESATITWLGKKFLFVDNVDYYTPSANDAAISTALNALGSGYLLSDNRLFNQSITAATQYIYIAYLDSMGGDIETNFLLNGIVVDSWDVKTFTYTNQFGYTSTYRLVKTQYSLIGEYLTEVR